MPYVSVYWQYMEHTAASSRHHWPFQEKKQKAKAADCTCMIYVFR